MLKKQLYRPFVSKSKNKKYAVYVLDKKDNPKLIHFGDKRFNHFRDELGHYKYLDTNDKERRRLYFARHGTTKDINTARFWANRILWNG